MMTTDQRAELDAAMAKATKAFPVTSRETPDYAEITFGSSQTQAMSMEPDTLLALNRVFEAAPLLTATIDAQAAEIARLREALAAMLLTHDAGGVTLGAAKDARAALASTGAA